CPGIIQPESFAPKARLRADSLRSPNCASTLTARPNPAASPPPSSSGNTRCPSTATTIAPASAPPAPSSVLLGLTASSSLRRPRPGKIPARVDPRATRHGEQHPPPALREAPQQHDVGNEEADVQRAEEGEAEPVHRAGQIVVPPQREREPRDHGDGEPGTPHV